VNPFLAVLLGLFFLAYVAIGAVAVRRPLLRRLAIREATLRPGQTAVFALGLLIAAAALFSIQVIFDTMYETNRVQALQTWTRDDIEISGGGGYFEPGLGQRLAARTQACSCIAAYQDAIVTAEDGRRAAVEASAPATQARALTVLGWSLCNLGRVAEGLAHLERAQHLAPAEEDIPTLLWTRGQLAAGLLAAGRAAAALLAGFRRARPSARWPDGRRRQ